MRTTTNDLRACSGKAHGFLVFLCNVIAFLLLGRDVACGDDIHRAAAAGDLAKVTAMLRDDPGLVSSKDSNGETPLHWAAEKGHKDVAEILLANKADVKAAANNGWTPLHVAAYWGYRDVVDLLLRNQAEPGATNCDGLTPLQLAERNGDMEVSELLRQHDGQEIATRKSALPQPKPESDGLAVAKAASEEADRQHAVRQAEQEKARADAEAGRVAEERRKAEEFFPTRRTALDKVMGQTTLICYSLKVAKMRILNSKSLWRQADPELLNLASMNRIEGFVVDSTNADLILFGKNDPSSTVLTLDDLVVALRALFKYHEYPSVNLSTNEGEWKHVFGPAELAGTAFADTLTRAGIELNELAFGQTSCRLKGLKTYIDDQSELPAPSLKNENPVFGFAASGTTRIQEHADIWSLADLKICVSVRLPASQLPDHAAEIFTTDATSRIDELFGSYTDFNRMRGLFELTALVSAMKQGNVDVPDLQWWLETYPLAESGNNASRANALDSQ